MAAPQNQPVDLQTVVARRLSCLSKSAFVVWMAAIGFVAILIGGWMHAKASIEHNLREQVFAMAQLAAERTSLAFDGISLTLTTVGGDLLPGDLDAARPPSPERRQALQSMLARARERNPSIASIVLQDASGRIVALAPTDAYAYSSADRPSELVSTVASDPKAPLVSSAFQDAVAGVWKIRLGQRVNGPRGGGVLVASVALDQGLVKSFVPDPVQDGDLIALYDASNQPLGAFAAGGITPARLAGVAAGGNAAATATADAVRYAQSEGDGVVRLVAARRLPHYPLFAVYGKGMDGWLVTWRQEQFLLALAAIAAFVVTAAIATGIQRRFALTEQLKQMQRDVEQSNDALRSALTGAETLAARDQLTGLWNRRNFDQRLDGAIAHALRHADTFSLLMIDIDHFKNVNDHYGHLTGDSVLRRFGEVLMERLRQNDVAARWGGEEFVVLADGATLENTRSLAEQVRESIAETTFAPVARVTVSIGIAEYQAGETGDDLLKRADKALYVAKRNGRNRVMAAEGHVPTSTARLSAA